MVIKLLRILAIILFLGAGCVFTINVFNSLFNSLYTDIVYIFLCYTIFYFGILILLNDIIKGNKYIKHVFFNILSLPISFVFGIRYIIAPVLSCLIFLAVYILPSILFLYFNELNPILNQYRLGIVYLLSLLSIVLFAYKSTYVMRFVIDMYKTKFLKRQLFNLSNQSFTRIFTYLSMIMIYILYNFLNFSDLDLDLVPFEMVSVVKEVFVTFIAIDSFIQIIIKKNK